jgi:hypothetical protein
VARLHQVQPLDDAPRQGAAPHRPAAGVDFGALQSGAERRAAFAQAARARDRRIGVEERAVDGDQRHQRRAPG